MKKLVPTFLALFCICPLFSLHAKPKPLAAIIFDMDGVLVDSEGAKFEAWKKALVEYNVTYSLEDYLPVVGHHNNYIVKTIAETKNITPKDDFVKIKDSYYKELQAKGLPSFEEAVSFAKDLVPLKNHSIALALASSAPKKEIDINLKKLGLENVFDVVVSGEDDLKKYQDSQGVNKPKPYVYQETAKQLNIAPEFCIVFEDTNAGVEAAHSAGMHAIAVPNYFTKNQDFSHALFILPSFASLHKALQEAQESKHFGVSNVMRSKIKNLFGR